MLNLTKLQVESSSKGWKVLHMKIINFSLVGSILDVTHDLQF